MTRRPRILWLPGLGGPGAAYAVSRMPASYDVAFLCDPDQPPSEVDVTAMRARGTLLTARGLKATVATALDEHTRDPFDAVAFYSEGRLKAAASIAERLGLRGHSIQTATMLTDKVAQRAALQRAEVPIPRWAEITEDIVLEVAASSVGFPAVLKPATGGGSLLTSAVSSLEDLRAAWQTAIREFGSGEHEALLTTRRPRMILESMLVGGGTWYDRYEEDLGDYVSVDTSYFDGAPRHLVTTDRTPLAEGFRETALISPSILRDDRQVEVQAMVELAARALGVTDGVLHSELKLTADGPRIIEVNGRPGGGMMTMLDAWDINLVDLIISQSLGHEPTALPEPNGCTAIFMPCLPHAFAGKHLRVTLPEGLQSAQGVRACYDLELTHFAGVGDGQTALVYAALPDHKSVLRLIDEVIAGTRVEVLGARNRQ